VLGRRVGRFRRRIGRIVVVARRLARRERVVAGIGDGVAQLRGERLGLRLEVGELRRMPVDGGWLGVNASARSRFGSFLVGVASSTCGGASLTLDAAL
jgi:hypothetical protein